MAGTPRSGAGAPQRGFAAFRLERHPFHRLIGGLACLKLLSGLLLGLLLAAPARGDRLVLKEGRAIFGTVQSEKDSVLRYLDRYGRPRRLAEAQVDSIQYDLKTLSGAVKAVYRRGQPVDQSGYFKLRYGEELDLELEYRTDSATEIDLLFRNQVQMRILPGSRFKVEKAPRDADHPLVLELREGLLLCGGGGRNALVRVLTPGGIAVGRGGARFGVRAGSRDSSLFVTNLTGLVGLQEKPKDPGELAVEEGKAMHLQVAEGLFKPRPVDSAEAARLRRAAGDMGRYRLSKVPDPPVGYLAKALTGLGFMVFFYGSTLGVLDYVNHI